MKVFRKLGISCSSDFCGLNLNFGACLYVAGFDVGLEMSGFQAGFELMFAKMNAGG